jgi:MFS family permease
MRSKGGAETSVGIALALLFAGGAFGKAVCGRLGERLGTVPSVVLTEALTALAILATIALPLAGTFILLPFLGIVLNGTSSILYGTVPELAKDGEVGKAFALFYTAVIGAGGLAPIAYGVVADHSSQTIGIVSAAMTAMLIIPMVFALRPFLRESHSSA